MQQFSFLVLYPERDVGRNRSVCQRHTIKCEQKESIRFAKQPELLLPERGKGGWGRNGLSVTHLIYVRATVSQVHQREWTSYLQKSVRAEGKVCQWHIIKFWQTENQVHQKQWAICTVREGWRVRQWHMIKFWQSSARAPFMRLCYICVTVACESLYGLIEKENATVTHR